MTIGLLGNTNVVFKRKFKWIADMWCYDDPHNLIILNTKKVIVRKRPTLNIDDNGKATWEPFQFDIECAGSTDNKELYEYLAKCYDYTNGMPNENLPATLRISMLDEAGEPQEEWLMNGVWPTAINFGELDFSSSEEVTLQLTVRFEKCRYRNLVEPKTD